MTKTNVPADFGVQDLVSKLAQVCIVAEASEPWVKTDQLAKGFERLSILTASEKKRKTEEVVVADEKSASVRFQIKHLDTRVEAWQMSEASTVASLKTQLANRQGVDKEQLRLILRGRPMLDDDTLGKHALALSDTILVVMQMRGGMFHFSSGREGFSQMHWCTPCAEKAILSLVKMPFPVALTRNLGEDLAEVDRQELTLWVKEALELVRVFLVGALSDIRISEDQGITIADIRKQIELEKRSMKSHLKRKTPADDDEVARLLERCAELEAELAKRGTPS